MCSIYLEDAKKVHSVCCISVQIIKYSRSLLRYVQQMLFLSLVMMMTADEGFKEKKALQ